MKISVIDKDLKKRVSNKKKEPIKRHVDKTAVAEEENSPMAPPSAYAPPSENMDRVELKDMSAFIKELIKDHNQVKRQLKSFEKTLMELREKKWLINQNDNQSLSEFYQFFDHKIMQHNRVEEKILFPLLQERLLESGEHSTDKSQTAIDIMEDDHFKFIQLGSLSFNLIGIASRLNCEEDKTLVFEMAYQSAMELIEMLRLHIFREDETLFQLAHQLISDKEFDEMYQQLEQFN